ISHRIGRALIQRAYTAAHHLDKSLDLAHICDDFGIQFRARFRLLFFRTCEVGEGDLSQHFLLWLVNAGEGVYSLVRHFYNSEIRLFLATIAADLGLEPCERVKNGRLAGAGKPYN